jgi:AraC-like DNA-binding protein
VPFSHPEPELSARLIRPFLRALQKGCAPVDRLTFASAYLDDPDARVPHHVAVALLERAIRGSGDEALGLHAAEHVEPGDFDVLEYASLSSRTVGESIQTANRYLRLVHDAAEFSLDTDGSVAAWRYTFSAALSLPPAAAEYFMAIFAVLGRRYAGRDFPGGVTVHFAHPRPRDISEYKRIFQGTLRFDQPQNALVLVASALDLPMAKSDAPLKTMLERMARGMLLRLPETGNLTKHVRQLLAAELRGGDPGIGHLAKKLHTTPRTLRRRLKEVGTTHRDILEELRRELASEYLGQRSLAITEVAFLLGYSTTSAFHKAFKRWMGVSATEYRGEGRRRK